MRLRNVHGKINLGIERVSLHQHPRSATNLERKKLMADVRERTR